MGVNIPYMEHLGVIMMYNDINNDKLEIWRFITFVFSSNDTTCNDSQAMMKRSFSTQTLHDGLFTYISLVFGS